MRIATNIDEEFRGRLRQLREKLGHSQRKMDKLLNIGTNSWQRYESGGVDPGGSIFVALAGAGVNINWLATGEGPMLLEGRSKEAHHLMVRELAGEYGAAEERARFRAPREAQMREAGQIVMQAISEVNFEPGALWVTVLQEMVLTYSMPPAAVRRLVETLAASQARRPNSPASD